VYSAEYASRRSGGWFAASHARRTDLSRSTLWRCNVVSRQACAEVGRRQELETELRLGVLWSATNTGREPGHILTRYLQVVHKCTKCAETLDGTKKEFLQQTLCSQALSNSQPLSSEEQSAVCHRWPAWSARHRVSPARPCESVSWCRRTSPDPRCHYW
jgi:hypothetical protein